VSGRPRILGSSSLTQVMLSAQAALKQANRRAEDLRAAAAATEARERDSAAQVDRANGIIERLTVRTPGRRGAFSRAEQRSNAIAAHALPLVCAEDAAYRWTLPGCTQ